MKDGDFVVQTIIYFKNICCICNNVFSSLYVQVTFFNLIKLKNMSLHLVYKYEYPQKNYTLMLVMELSQTYIYLVNWMLEWLCNLHLNSMLCHSMDFFMN